MKKTLAASVVLALLSAPAFAAPIKHRSAVEPAMPSENQIVPPNYSVRRPDVVTFGDRVIGADPDPNIRAGLAHDPVPSEY
jgi:hypothetical protein